MNTVRPEPGAAKLIGALPEAIAPMSDAHWTELRTFLAVARLGSFNRAAESLNVSHHTVGRRIRRLHDIYGVPLVIASKQGSFLTEQGRRVLAVITSIDRAIFSLQDDLRGSAGEASGTVRVGISDGMGLLFLVPALRGFRTNHGQVAIYLQRPNTYRALRDDRTDIMVGFTDPGAEDLTSIRLGSVHFLAFASPAYLAARGETSDPHSFVDTERFKSNDEAWRPWRDFTETGTVVGFCDESISYAAMIKDGLGIGLLPSFNLTEGAFVRMQPDLCISIPIYAAALTERLAARHVALVYEFVVENLSTSPCFSEDPLIALGTRERAPGYDLLYRI